MATQNSSLELIEAAGRNLHGFIGQAQALNALYLRLDGTVEAESSFALLADSVLESLAVHVEDYVSMVNRHLAQGAA